MTAATLTKPEHKAEVQKSTEGKSPKVRYLVPAVDIFENSDSILLALDVPGISNEDIEISVEKDVLTIQAVAKTSEEKPVGYREFSTVGYKRSFTLGEKIDREKINAVLKNGVLEVTLHLAEETKPKRINVQAS